VIYWRRPGKAIGHSATTGYLRARNGAEKFFCFSSNGFPFEPQQSYSRFAVYAWLNHGGDFAAAARAMGDLGYGQRASTRAPRPRILQQPGVRYRRGKALVTFDVEV
jgi:hypothetical protein